MFGFKRLSESLEGIRQELRALPAAIRESQDESIQLLGARIEDLELTVTKRLAEGDALMERVEARFRAARSAEERARHREKKIQRDAEDAEEGGESSLEDVPEPWRSLIRGGDAGNGEAEGMPAVPERVGSPQESGKDRAKRLKWGG